MKKFSLIVIMLMTTIVLFGQKKGPFSYPYYIKGVTEINPNDGKINLTNIEVKGFDYSDFNKRGEWDEKARFVFEKIRTNPPISLNGKKLQYWRQDKSGEWITDAEGGSGTFSDKLEKDITIMMVLDCSASMGSDFIRLQTGAISFLDRIFSTSNDGHIKLGIIGFSSIAATEQQVFEITPLTSDTFYQAKRFINSLKKENNTALYYAVNKATDMLSDYVSNELSASNEYGGTYMLVFTDGLDNASQFRDYKIFRSDDAFDWIDRKLDNTKVRDSLIETYIIGARGADLTTVSQQNEFKRRLEALIPIDEYGILHRKFIYLEKMSELEDTFKEIAESLTDQWLNLVCLTSLAHEGGVCWTLGEVIKPEVIKPTDTYKLLLGVNAGIGLDGDGNAFVGTGLDFAYPITKKFSIGGYLDTKIGDGGGFTFGALTTLGNYHDGHNAFIGGLGLGSMSTYYDSYYSDGYSSYESSYVESAICLNLRAGMLFRNGIYFMGELSAGELLGVSVRVGYNFGKFIKIRK